MHIGSKGNLEDLSEIRAGFIGCGSHSFRNVYPAFQFTRVNLVATCDLDPAKAEAFAGAFGAAEFYTDYHEMLDKADLDAVFIVTGYTKEGRPLYSQLAVDCLKAGCHVWIEKPPAGSCAEIDAMIEAAAANDRQVVAGMKKMFFPVNRKVRELMYSEDFGNPNLVLLQYPQHIPTMEEIKRWRDDREPIASVISFLDHLCHPVSLMVYLLGMPKTLFYQRAQNGSGNMTFTFASGAVASLALTCGGARNAGMERTTVISDNGRHIVADNNIRVYYHRSPEHAYGVSPDYFTGALDETGSFWEPEFSLGNLYNKGLFLLGYYDEVNEFAQAILEERAPRNGTLEQARQVTRIFEAACEGPGQLIQI
jgi:predicted dehydrogenase